MLSSFLDELAGTAARRRTNTFHGVRRGISLCVTLAFFQSQLAWCAGTGARLIPGAPIGQSAPPQPGQVQQTPAPPPAEDRTTTVVQVPVPKDSGLDITVLEGEGAANVVGKKSSAKPLVEVRDEKNQLVEGAVVTFVAPPDGPSVVFSNGLRTMTVMTDAAGRARAPSLRAVTAGTFRLQVSASYKGQMVSTNVSETNYESASQAKNKQSPAGGNLPAANKKIGGLSGTTLAIIIGVGAAAAVGIGVGLGHKGSSSATSTATIGGPGTPTVGAP